jgi:hypothetical protein
MPAEARSDPPGVRDGRDVRDSRVPCALCGGLIHPIAGRCKHCKADLSAYRASPPAANMPLPALGPHGAVGEGMLPPGLGHLAAPPAQRVLPPRPTTRSHAAQPASRWRRWPVIVIVVASMAIVAAVVLMLWPAARGRDGSRLLRPPPAPERMDTQTPAVTPRIDAAPHAAPPAAGAPDPWATPAPPSPPHASIDPGTPDGSQVTGDDPDDGTSVDPLGPSVPSARSATPPQRPRSHQSPPVRPDIDPGDLAAIISAPVGSEILTRVCHKLIACGVDAAQQQVCDSISVLGALNGRSPPAGSCPAADRCYHGIEAFDCGSQANAVAIMEQVVNLRDCVDATHC